MPRFLVQTSIPAESAAALRRVLLDAGIGTVGNYAGCSGSWLITGRFVPQEGAVPAEGAIGELSEVVEEMIQIRVAEDGDLKKTVATIRSHHPYEEPIIDVIRLEDIS